MNWRAPILAILLALAPAGPSAAQSAASLIADSVRIDGDAVVTASGNVEVFAEGIRLSASRISYDSRTDKLVIEGPIVLSRGTDTVILASSAELDSGLRDGILRSARLVLDQQLQLAATEINRVNGRYTQLFKTVASSCRVCAGRQPLWEIRAEKIIHDEQTRQLYFDKAQLRVGGIPVFYLPRLRLPDPTVKRATGFLVPDIRTSSRLGTGVKIPYFIAIGDSADLTFTPYLSPVTTTLETRYRQAFRRGRLQFDAALTADSLLPGETRGYISGHGNFRLPLDFRLSFDLNATSDPGYLLEYGYSGDDRLVSDVTVGRTRPHEQITASLSKIETLRGSELAIVDQVPDFLASTEYERRFFPRAVGGQGSWSLRAEHHRRVSSADQLGRDVTHVGGRLNWSRSETFGPGIVGKLGAELSVDAYRIAQDSAFPMSVAYLTPALEAELRWPWVRSGNNGAHMVLEPVMHVAWTRNIGENVPNEDSTLVEFDEGNLFSISRFPGEDRYEQGFRTSLGVKWTRYDRRGWTMSFALGRVLRESDPGQFSRASGLDGASSDWLAAAQLKLNSRFSLTARALFDDDLSLTKTDATLNWTRDRFSLASTFAYVIPDPAETRPDLTSQLNLNARYDISDNWRTTLQYQYDFGAVRATKAAVGLNYTNECIRVDLSLSRRFTSSTSVAPTTDIGLSVSLLGFGSNRGAPPRSCSGI